MEKIKMAVRYVAYLIQAIKSQNCYPDPILLFKENFLKNYSLHTDFKNIDSIRVEMLSSKDEIMVDDLGAGSQFHSTKNRKIHSIAKYAAKTPKYGKLLYRIIDFYKPKNMIELGTSLGISALYQALANPNGNLTTIEGSNELCKIAVHNFKNASVKNIDVISGDFKKILPQTLKRIGKLDYIFFDGNHKQDATVSYFNTCLPYAHENTIMIFDDIHWSKDMEQAWNTVQMHTEVTSTYDLFQMGIVFFNKTYGCNHYVVYF